MDGQDENKGRHTITGFFYIMLDSINQTGYISNNPRVYFLKTLYLSLLTDILITGTDCDELLLDSISLSGTTGISESVLFSASAL